MHYEMQCFSDCNFRVKQATLTDLSCRTCLSLVSQVRSAPDTVSIAIINTRSLASNSFNTQGKSGLNLFSIYKFYRIIV